MLGKKLLFVFGCVAAVVTGCEPGPVSSTGFESSPTAEDDVARPSSQETTGETRGPSLAELLLDENERELLSGGKPTPPAASTSTSDPPDRVQPPSAPEQGLAPRTTTDNGEIRKMTGRYVTIYTDLPVSAAANELTLVFDKAIKQWDRYFHVADGGSQDFRMTGYVIDKKQRFHDADLLPDDLPPFLHGYQRGAEFWVYDQPSEYYLRHMVLHEGTHGYMNLVLKGAGPPWYREGIAELLATHKWEDHRLTLNYMPRNKSETPYWGRIRIIQHDFEAENALMIEDVMRLKEESFLHLRAYAWSWAAAAFLDGHPQFQQRFRMLRNDVRDQSSRFTRGFEQQLINELRELDEEWQLFVRNIEYGYDFKRSKVEYRAGKPLPPQGAEVTIMAGRGWQSSGYHLVDNQTYDIRARGRYQLNAKKPIWWCEPGGVTFQYYQGQPLGILMGNVRLDKPRPGVSNLAVPLPIGRGRVVQPGEAGTLYLRINESAANLADNSGVVKVRITPAKKTDDKES